MKFESVGTKTSVRRDAHLDIRFELVGQFLEPFHFVCGEWIHIEGIQVVVVKGVGQLRESVGKKSRRI